MTAPTAAGDLAAHVAAVPLVDHHAHGAFAVELGRERFEAYLNEGPADPVPLWMTQFDSQLGFAIRRWCAPLLDLPAHAPADDYWARRCRLGVPAVTARLLRAAGVSDWLLDTGFGGGSVLDPPAMAACSGGRTHEIVRLESLAEDLASRGASGREYPDRFRSALAEAAGRAVGVKTVLAYRTGFDIDLSRPDDRAVADAAGRWLDAADPQRPRLEDPVLLRFGLHAAVDLGRPIQIHTGFGDPDLDLHRANPLLLVDLLRNPAVAGVPVLLLHCYPYHREAGYLAQAFPDVYFDIGLGVNHVGVRAADLVAESFETAPFAKQLFSSDAYGPPELHYLGALLWRRAIARTLGRWVADGDWSAADARRVVDMVGRGNAERVYGLS